MDFKIRLKKIKTSSRKFAGREKIFRRGELRAGKRMANMQKFASGEKTLRNGEHPLGIYIALILQIFVGRDFHINHP